MVVLGNPSMALESTAAPLGTLCCSIHAEGVTGQGHVEGHIRSWLVHRTENKKLTQEREV